MVKLAWTQEAKWFLSWFKYWSLCFYITNYLQCISECILNPSFLMVFLSCIFFSSIAFSSVPFTSRNLIKSFSFIYSAAVKDESSDGAKILAFIKKNQMTYFQWDRVGCVYKRSEVFMYISFPPLCTSHFLLYVHLISYFMYISFPP